MRLRLLLCTGFAALALAACGEEKIDVPEITDTGATATDAASAVPSQAATTASAQPTDVVEAVEISADAVRVGTSIDASQAVSGAKPVYGLGDTVHASIDTRAHPGATATVYWTYQDGLSQKVEKKAITGTNVAFQFSRADGMKPGNYNVGIDVDDVPVGIADFKVR